MDRRGFFGAVIAFFASLFLPRNRAVAAECETADVLGGVAFANIPESKPLRIHIEHEGDISEEVLAWGVVRLSLSQPCKRWIRYVNGTLVTLWQAGEVTALLQCEHFSAPKAAFDKLANPDDAHAICRFSFARQTITSKSALTAVTHPYLSADGQIVTCRAAYLRLTNTKAVQAALGG